MRERAVIAKGRLFERPKALQRVGEFGLHVEHHLAHATGYAFTKIASLCDRSITKNRTFYSTPPRMETVSPKSAFVCPGGRPSGPKASFSVWRISRT